MKLYDSVELAARNLRESVLRNSLTTLGISVGVASLVAMLSLGIGLQQLFSQRLHSSGLFDRIVVTSRRDLRGFNREQEQNGPAPAESPDLDEAARHNIEKIPGVVEAYPDLRFITELRYDDKAHLTMVSGMTLSQKSSDSLAGMQGSFFSSSDAHEVIVQKSFAAELLGKPRARGLDEVNVAEVAKPLLGKQIIMRYAERSAGGGDGNSASYSVISRELPLTIVGVADLDPDSMGGGAQARVFLPQNLLESLHAMQAYDFRDSTRATSAQPDYSRMIARVNGASKVDEVEQAIKKLGFNTIDSGCQQGTANGLPDCGFVPFGFRKPRPDGCLHRDHQHSGDGDSGAAPRNRNHEGDWGKRWRLARLIFRGSWSDGDSRRSVWHLPGLGHRTRDQHRHQHLFPQPRNPSAEDFDGAVVAGGSGNPAGAGGQPGFRALPGGEGGEA